MNIHAYKYQGAGNDFVILDNRSGAYDHISSAQVKLLCDRRFGIGSDGLMLLSRSGKYDFSMRYFNSDGPEATMCGNGGRCLVAFAARMGINHFDFEAIDGFHTAHVLEYSDSRCLVRLRMKDLKADEYRRYSPTAWFLDTGSPHYVEFVSQVKDYPVIEKGRYWRHHADFPGGTNADFVECSPGALWVRTFERGVEDETYACGTGVTASAIAAFLQNSDLEKDGKKDQDCLKASYPVHALRDDLNVDFLYEKSSRTFKDIYLTGPATFVFECDFDIPDYLL